MGEKATVALSEKAVKAYLDSVIRYWRIRRDQGDELGSVYVDAFQSVRVSLFGETCPVDEDELVTEPR